MLPHRTSSEDQQPQHKAQHLLPDAPGVLAALEARSGVTPAVLVCTEGVLSSAQATLSLGKLLTCAKVSMRPFESAMQQSPGGAPAEAATQTVPSSPCTHIR